MASPNIHLFNDSRLIRRLGNLTASSTSEVLLSARAYTEQGSQAQRSVKSSSNQDSSGGSGAKVVRIDYLDSNYVEKYEDVTLSGTTKVSTVATDIRFVQNFRVIQGAAAAGAISLLDGTGGGASEFCGIGTGTEQAFLAHYYVPAGKQAWVIQWGASVDDEVKFKLKGQDRIDGTNLVDINLDLIDLRGITTPPGLLEFEHELKAVLLPEKTRAWVAVVPVQSTSTVIRGHMCVWVDDA